MAQLKVGDRIQCEVAYEQLDVVGRTGIVVESGVGYANQPTIRIHWDDQPTAQSSFNYAW